MSTEARHSGLRGALQRVLRRLLMAWVRIKLDPESPQPGICDEHRPVCYVLERNGLSNRLLLDAACEQAGLPAPMLPLQVGTLKRRHAYLALNRRERWFGRRAEFGQPPSFAELLKALGEDPAADVQIVPVTIFVGRAPDRDSGWFSVLFSEAWVIGGRLRRLFAILLNGRSTRVHFSPAISLRQLADEGLGEARSVRKLSRVLRVHFRRLRTAVIGPDLSHRRTLVNQLLRSANVRQAITQHAARESVSEDKASARARAYAMEIAADYSHPVVRSLSFVLTGFWNRIYDGVSVQHLDSLKRLAPGHEIIYVPCHRSHIDYLLLSYLLYSNGLVVPHIAAGVNLNLPLIGPVLRRGGAFFLRRSFKSNPLYATVFSEYVSTLLGKGVSIEYFIEGGRSRTGRLLQPRGGMLSITMRAFLQQSRRPVVFQPVYIGYEKLIEGSSYTKELIGQAKKKESLFGVLRSFGILRRKYGRVSVNFAEPIFLHDLLDSLEPQWRDALGQEQRPAWMGEAVNTLAETIQVRINAATDVNPVNLLALTLLSTPKHAIGEDDLIRQLDIARALLLELPYGERMTVTERSAADIVSYGESLKIIQRRKHPLGDVLSSEGEEAILLSYFRNNVLHLFATASWIACCFLDNRRFPRSAIVRLGKLVYPFIRSELFLPWSVEEFGQRIQGTIDLFLKHGLLESDGAGRVLKRPLGGSHAAFQLRMFAHSLVQAFERYYICIAVLVKNGSGTLSSSELETLCELTAQRLSLLLEMNAPEFFDRALFRNFIAMLREQGIVRSDEQGRLLFDETLVTIHTDAKVILSREIRHGILKLTPEARAALT